MLRIVELAAILGRAWTVGWSTYESNRRVPFGEKRGDDVDGEG